MGPGVADGITGRHEIGDHQQAARRQMPGNVVEQPVLVLDQAGDLEPVDQVEAAGECDCAGVVAVHPHPIAEAEARNPLAADLHLACRYGVEIEEHTSALQSLMRISYTV